MAEGRQRARALAVLGTIQVVGLVFGLGVSRVARAEDAAPPVANAPAADAAGGEVPAGGAQVGNPPTEQTDPASARYNARSTLRFEHWENGLDVKLTSLFNHSASDLSAPTMMLTAQWNRRFQSETYAGITLSGVPQQANATTTDGSTKTYSTYYGGIDVGQGIYTYKHYRVTATVSGGIGVVYVRMTPAGQVTSSVDKPNFTFVEPGLYATFYDWHDIQIGLTVSYRWAWLQTTPASVSDADISSAAYGLTFRTLLH